MRLILVITALCLLTGCATAPAPLPVQPAGPTSPSVVSTVGKQWDTADAKVAAAVTIAQERADNPAAVRSETAVALSFLPPADAGELAIARARSIAADPKAYAAAENFGKKLLAQMDTSWLRVLADQSEAKRVSDLKDARIVELTQEVVRVKKEASNNVWTLAGVGIAVLGAIAMVFAGPRIGATLIASGAAIGAFPQIADSEYFAYIAGSTLALAAGLGLWYIWDKVRDANNAPYEPPQK